MGGLTLLPPSAGGCLLFPSKGAKMTTQVAVTNFDGSAHQSMSQSSSRSGGRWVSKLEEDVLPGH
jgi:hypothetical protein